MYLGCPGWHGWKIVGEVARPEIDGREQHADVLDARSGGEHEQLFGGGVADGDAAGGEGSAMDHDVAAGVCASFGLGVEAVGFVGIIDAEGEMEAAVGLEGLDGVDAFGRLFVALAQFGA